MNQSHDVNYIKCPRCRSQAIWQGNPSRPFCSEKCRLIDFGRWSNEDYNIPGEDVIDPEQDDEYPA